ncbi:MAG: hypothetical protein B7Y39_03875 [Bdellovibrio sp. 28-41-41]|nr:MAG: hypothetical protein B7Y39_03875 [Bdellovibrio sp. 28-41-41]
MYKSCEKYLDNDELLTFLNLTKENHSRFFDFESIGKSSLGEDIYLVTLTDKHYKHHSEKPAFWIDANIHASEVTGTQGVLFFIERLLDEKHKDSSKHKELMKKMTYYLVPRFSPDGARAFFKETNSFRSTPLEMAYEYSNFKRQDLDGDGEITLMRWKDKAGPFKELVGHPGVLVPREASDFSLDSEDYYQVVPEGTWTQFDGFKKTKNYDFGYDFNRQSPSFFAPEGLQRGAGALPLEFPETRAVAEAIRIRKNIFASNSYHTYGGFIIKTPANVAESSIPLEDRIRSEMISELLQKNTQYSIHSGGDDFVYVPGQPLPGTFDEWYYLHLGIMGMTIEYWDVWKHAGMSWKKAVEKYETLSSENMVKLLKWAKENLKREQYFKDWTSYDHPQLGKIEIGGFKTAFFLTNPPIPYLAKEIENVFEGSFAVSRMAPLAEIDSVVSKKIDSNVSQVTVVVKNVGYFPTYGSQQALKVKIIDKPVCKTSLNSKSDDFKIISQPAAETISHLKGFSDGNPRVSPFFGTGFTHEYEQQLTWMFQGSGDFTFEINYHKGGVVRQTVIVG